METLFSAGGMRVKIIEGMAMGKCVISTSIGAEGIEHVAGRHLLIADNANAFVQQIDKVLADPDTAEQIGLNAAKLVRAKYANPAIIGDLVAFYSKLLRK